MKNNPNSVSSSLHAPLTKTCLAALIALSCTASAQVVIDGDGLFFGLEDDDPVMRKISGSPVGVVLPNDLELDLARDAAFSIYSDADGTATFRAGEGHTSRIYEGNWYRIARSSDIRALRTSALFSLRSLDGHYLTFRAGMDHSHIENSSFTLLSNSNGSNGLIFSEVRFVSSDGSGGSRQPFYLEVKVVRGGSGSYAIMENLGVRGWTPLDWELVDEAVPSGYFETRHDLSKLFLVAGENPVLSVDRTAGVAITGGLTLDGSSVLTENSIQTGLILGDSFSISPDPIDGEYSLALGEGAFASNSSIAIGEFTHAEKSSLALGFASSATGESSSALGDFTWARASVSLAAGSNTYTNGFASAVFGQYNKVDIGEDPDRFIEWIGDDKHSVFEIGIGSSLNDRKNAMTVMQDGTIELGKDQNNEVPLKVSSDGSVILNKAQGDIPMGIYGQ